MTPCPHNPPKQGLYDPQFEKDACGVGFVVDIQGRKSHKIVKDALTVLDNLRHRGACGCEVNTGDGAGILMQVPHNFLKEAAKKANITLPSPGEYGVGMVFLPPKANERAECEKRVQQVVEQEGQKFLGWRDVPTDHSSLGNMARSSEPVIRQFFVGRSSKLQDDLAFERKLFMMRKHIQNEIRYSNIEGGRSFYICSLSSRTIIYKGLLMSEQVPLYFPDLNDPAMESALGIVHSRFSTNTFPSWERAHPYRFIAHNGEINTLRGNVNWMHARQSLFETDVFGEDIKKMLPVIRTDGSDSAMFDNCFEFLVMSGRSLPHAMMMMIPEPWSNHESMSDERKAFYEYHSCLMEPWDGPASIAFTDGLRVGAVLDRNGLRPSRYYVTKDDFVVMASEVGVLDIPPERILHKGRLQPGRMLLIDTVEKRIVADEEIKQKICAEKPYRMWLKSNLVKLEDLAEPPYLPQPDHQTMLLRQHVFGYTYEDLRTIMAPMAESGVEAMGSMGDDAPLAVLSDKPQLLYNYFKQLFAQVTNPPIDAIREEIVTGTETTIGPEGNLLDPKPESARQIQLKSPVLTDEEFYKLVHVNHPWFRSRVFPIVFPAANGGKGLEKAMEALFASVDAAIKDGVNIIVLSDRMTDRDNAPIPALLAVAGLHHHLIREGTRTRVGLILESGEPREVHHFALLIGFGVGAINPYLALESLDDMIREGLLTTVDHKKAVKNYVKAAAKGVVKVISKMGISTIQSYGGAQIFEAVGLNQALIDKYFTWTCSRISGIGIEEIARESAARHRHAYPEYGTPNGKTLEAGGKYQWRKEGEHHLFNPESIHSLQNACRTNNYAMFKKYSELINNQAKRIATLRGLMEFQNATPVPIEEVDSVETICKRFKTGAMSYGSISKEAHETLAIAMNRLGAKSNTGEGGEDPARYTKEANGDSKNSAIKQVASGRFGVTSNYLVQAQEIQIKMAQGAKPGEGGQLPGKKVYPWIAKVRHSTAGVGLISPPPHHDIYSIEDLAELIHDLKNANYKARISVKLVSEVGVGTIAAGVAKAHADVVLIAGHDGGTGASPQTSIKHAGLPWELGLAETHQTLLLNKLRDRIVVETDGQLKTGRDVAIATLLGAEEFGFATAPLVAMGCIMMRVCHLDTCPVGVATQNPELRAKFTGNADHVVTFMKFIAQEMREVMAQLGFRTVNEMIGRTDKLQMRPAIEHWKAKGLDLSPILYQPKIDPSVGRYQTILQDHGLDKALDQTTLLELCKPALERKEKVHATVAVRNVNRVIGTMLGSEITRRYGPAGLPEDTIKLHLKGSAGQSLGAFIPRGLTLQLEGDANDYVGKGLSGGKIIVYPSRESTFIAEQNIIIGNVAFYGATAGEAYIRGVAGERFAVRNSGVHAVVESVGDHGCEYMTGGRVVILGQTGRNFAAGMSGGIAYVLDQNGAFPVKCNRQMVDLESLENEDEIEELRQMIQKHFDYTGSTVAAKILQDWPGIVSKFVRVMPKDYKRALSAAKRVEALGLSGEEAEMAAFQENMRDLSRVSGN
jgi:glutamate synthase domain-containing protein 2/glutamate synthase domain-containing protein 1/glutamate synthase domain-containing protein 3